MPTVKVSELGRAALENLGVYRPGQQLSSANEETCKRVINQMLGQWRQKRLMAVFTDRVRFDLESDKGGEDDPYTIGPGGDFDTEKPANQAALLAANLILTSPGPPNEVRVPLGIYTDAAYFANAIPGMRSGQPTSLYYNATYAGGLGQINLWPVPDVDTNDLELLLLRPLVSFATLNGDYDIPDGWDEAIIYNAMRRLQSPFGVVMSADDKQTAINALKTIQAANTGLSDLSSDAYMFSQGRQTMFNINTGTGG